MTLGGVHEGLAFRRLRRNHALETKYSSELGSADDIVLTYIWWYWQMQERLRFASEPAEVVSGNL